MKIWKNGAIVPATGAIDAGDRGVTLGDGLFETMAMVDGAVLRIDRHVARLSQGLGVLGIDANISSDLVKEAAAALSAETKVTEGAFRLTVLRGSGARGVLPVDIGEPTVLMSLAEMRVGDDSPMNVIIARGTRRNDRSPMSQIKSTNYGDAILARMEAANAGVDDALMLNTRDTIAEATAANIFCVINDDLVTPPVSDGALPGVMRDIVIAHEGAEERPVTEADLSQAQEVFLTSSISIRPVISINSLRVGTGRAGDISARLSGLPRTEI